MGFEESHLIQHSFPKFSDQTNRHMEDAKVRYRRSEKDVLVAPVFCTAHHPVKSGLFLWNSFAYIEI